MEWAFCAKLKQNLSALARQRTQNSPLPGIRAQKTIEEIFQDASSAQEPAITRYVCNTFQKVLLPGKYRDD